MSNHTNTPEITCPSCHALQPVHWLFWSLSDDGEKTCSECGQRFVWLRHVSVTYSTEPVEARGATKKGRNV